MDKRLRQLLEQHAGYFSILDNNRIKCEINGHCFPPSYGVVFGFINGPKFAKLKRRFDAENSLSQFQPLITQSKNFPLMLYCTLTGQLMDKSVDAAKRHMQGKKFKKAKEQYDKNGAQELKPEPDIESVLGIPPGRDKEEEQRSEEGPGIWIPDSPTKEDGQAAAAGSTGNGVAAMDQDNNDDNDEDDEAVMEEDEDGGQDNLDGEPDADARADSNAQAMKDGSSSDFEFGEEEDTEQLIPPSKTWQGLKQKTKPQAQHGRARQKQAPNNSSNAGKKKPVKRNPNKPSKAKKQKL